MNKTSRYLSNYEGRDKLLKMVQYLSRFLMHQTRTNPDASEAWKNLFIASANSRKLFRLLKSLVELQKLQELLEKPPKDANQYELILSNLKSDGSKSRLFSLLVF